MTTAILDKNAPPEQTWQQAKALAAIHEAGREIAATLDLDRTLRLVMQKAAETLPSDAGAIFIQDKASQLFRVAVSHNLPPEQEDEITFAFDEGVPGWVVGHRQPLVIGDAPNDPRVHPKVVASGVVAVLAIPLICRERVVGVLNLFSRHQPHAFNEEAVQLAQVFADQAAVFLENARLVGELRQAAADLEKRVEERTRQLEEKQAQVIQAEKMAAVGRLAGSLAHEVNNPLQAIMLHLQLLAEDDLPATAALQLAIVRQEFDRIAAIAGRLLDFQRPQAERKQTLHLPQVLDDVLLLAGKQLQRAGIEIMVQIQSDLPPLLAVENQLKQVFLNLLLNGIEAMPDGGCLEIGLRQEGDSVMITFTDEGDGLPPAAVSQMFEPFFTTKATGSGLGLAISHEIVANHGGTLTAVNQANGGAQFRVRLPVAGGK
jgi:signal transduction histidine kinase